MSKRFTTLAFLFAVIAWSAIPVLAQMHEHPGRGNDDVRKSPNAAVAQTIGTHEFSVEYSRPFVKGRTVFGELEPFGQVWRSGANEATTIVIPTNVTVQGQALAAGVYALMTIPGESEWSIIFNSQAKQWGAFKHEAAKDVLVVKATPMEAPHAEMLTYKFENVTASSATAMIHWGTTAVPFEIAIAD